MSGHLGHFPPVTLSIPVPVPPSPAPPPALTVYLKKCPLCFALLEDVESPGHARWHRLNSLHGPDCAWLTTRVRQEEQIVAGEPASPDQACGCGLVIN